MAQKNGMKFLECSAKLGENVDRVFSTLTEIIDERIDRKEIDPRNEAIGIKIGLGYKSVVQEK